MQVFHRILVIIALWFFEYQSCECSPSDILSAVSPKIVSHSGNLHNNKDATKLSKFNAVMEPMCTPDPHRFALYPIKSKNLWDMYKKHVASFWTVEEVDLSMDIHDWKHKLNDDERHFIQMVLAFFAGA